MSNCQRVANPLARCIQQHSNSQLCRSAARSFTTTIRARDEASVEVQSAPVPDPNTVTYEYLEKKLMKTGLHPIGSRRRRAATRSSENVPFEQLPYQCFQEARKVLQADRQEKLDLITEQRRRIEKLEAKDGATYKGGERSKQDSLQAMRHHLEQLKIMADINDPLIKKRFEDGQIDMTKPIYRYMADRKWREYARKIIVQRIEQMKVVPDLLPHLEPTADVRLAFGRRKVVPGEFVDSRVSEKPAKLQVQVFDKGERLITVVIVDSDVPDPESDKFSSRCHYLATNIPIDPTTTSLPLANVKDDKTVLSWLPPFAQKGSPYHRLTVFVLEQRPGQVFDVEKMKKWVRRDDFTLRSFVGKFQPIPIGVNIFRAQWDEGTAGVMQRHNIPGADIEFKRTKVVALKVKQQPRGWEAKHFKAKYKPLGIRRLGLHRLGKRGKRWTLNGR